MNFLRQTRGIFLQNTFAYERRKIILLSISLLCLVGCYTIIRELRDVLFVSMVGFHYIQYAQILSLLTLIPALFVYGYLADHVQKYRLHQISLSQHALVILESVKIKQTRTVHGLLFRQSTKGIFTKNLSRIALSRRQSHSLKS